MGSGGGGGRIGRLRGDRGLAQPRVGGLYVAGSPRSSNRGS